ncbi:hypothetical protein B0H17DRAFT_1207236 [Mycena rosella]|uniref:Uncharacterized protein n=1 Tax=Mycena rosella TaxID=1033263 RepID=A0AAD7D3A7_MYCRO|nr:hypothetical protein B0H17DRAFT_1207236 [Mycena rosella]
MAKEDSPKLRVVGFNEDTKAVFRTCNPEGHDYIEVPWSRMDSVKWIAQRLEDKIRVSLHHWYLATADGVIFRTFGELVMSTEAFRVKDQVVLTLLMPTDLNEFSDSHLKQHEWRRTAAVPGNATNDLERCVAEFHLIDPKPSEAWGACLAQRKAADKHLEDGLAEHAGEDRPEIYKKIEAAVDDVLACTDLDDAEDAVHDCIVPLSPELIDDGWGNVSGADVLSRIYSPTNPAAVDVYLEYHYRTRYSSVEFHYNVYYRVHASIANAQLSLTTPRGPRKMNGFRPFMQMGLADVPAGKRWRAIEERTVRETLRLVLASVGISFSAASDPEDEDDEDAFEMGQLRWEGLEGSERWLGRNIRRVAGCDPMARDGEESAEEEDFEEEDDSDEEDDDEDFSDEEQFGGGAGPECRHQ